MLKFLMVLVVLSAAAGDDPPKPCAEIQPPCTCVEGKIESIKCTCTTEEHDNRTLSQLLKNVPATTTTILDITSCKFNVAVDDLKEHTSLTKLTLGNDEIVTIAPSAFATLVVLTELDLQYNHLVSSSLTGVFKGLGALTILRMEHNDIATLETLTFPATELKALNQLYLDNNKLAKLNGVAFADQPTLDTLSVNGNELVEVNFTSAKFPNLKTLNLAENQLKTLNKGCMVGFKQLKELDVSSNKITEVSEDAFEDVSKTLTKVDLHDNELAPTLSPAFSSLNLRELDVSYNSLYWMDDATLKWDKLDEVHLRNNPWDCECLNDWLINRPVVYKSHNHTVNTLVCGTPQDVKGKSVFDKAVKKSFKCPGHSSGNGTTAAGFGIGLIVGLLLAVICFVIYCRYSASKKRSSQYSHHINT